MNLAKLIIYLVNKEKKHELETEIKLEPNLQQILAFIIFIVPLFYFYDSLFQLKIFYKKIKMRSKNILKKVAANQNKLRNWAKFDSLNFQHKYDLVEAEKARILGQNWQASEYYEKAIKGAHENGFIETEALAYELAAKFYLSHNRNEFAQLYLKNAYSCYLQGGKMAQIQNLEQQYPEFLGFKYTQTPKQTSLEFDSQLYEREKLLTQFLEALPVGVLIHDVTGQLFYLNPAAQRLFHQGIKPDISPTELVLVEQLYKARTNQPLPTQQQPGLRSLNGETLILDDLQFHSREKIISLEFHSQPIFDQQGNIIYSISVLIDISQRKQTEKILTESNRALETQIAEQTQELKENEARLKLALEMNAAICWERDLTTNQIQFTGTLIDPAKVHIMSYAEALNWVHPEDQEKVHQANESAIATLSSFEIEHRIIGGENPRKWKWVLAKAKVLTDETGQPTRMIGLSIDINERKHVEQALRESEERFREIAETMSQIFFVRSAQNGQFLYISPAYEKMWGYSCESLYQDATQWLKSIHPEDLKTVQNSLQEQFQGKAVKREYRIRRADGSSRWIKAEISVIDDEAGQPLRYVGIAEDITERKQIELALQHSEARYLAILQDQTELITRFLPDGTLTFINEAYCRYFGIKREDCLGRTYQPIIFEEDRELIEQKLSGLSPTNPVVTIENRVIVGGEVRWTQWINRAFFDQAGCLMELQSVGRDISDRKRTELELQEAKVAAEAANEAKSAFLANISHELRTPLNAILGFAQVMMTSPTLSPQNQQHLDIILRSGEHLLTLINDVLDLAKIEAKRLTLNPQNFDLYSFLSDLEAMFRLKAQTKHLQLIFEYDPDVPRYIQADELKLRQVLINLLGNAIKFTQTGSVTLRVSRRRQFAVRNGQWAMGNGQWAIGKSTVNRQPSTVNKIVNKICFEIEDTGVGIDPKELEQIFQAFVQAQTGGQTQEGTGLGLAISHSFVKLMGGEITVHSQIGQGSLFKFEIPVTAIEGRTIQAKQCTNWVFVLEPHQQSYRILIVDDKWDNRQLLLQLLSPLGFEIREATNGQEAVAIWKQWQPHLIWMDVRMPILNGYEAMKQIKSTPQGKATPIIALSASQLESDQLQGSEISYDGFVRKPFQTSEIFEILEKHIGIQLICQEPTPPALAISSPSEPLTSQVLAVLPKEWLSSFHQATTEGDFYQMLALINQLRPDHEEIANSLTDLTNNFQFVELLSLTKVLTVDG